MTAGGRTRLTLGAVVAFLVCIVASAHLYPGGTWIEPGLRGFSFWENYWCDLLSPVAIGGGDHALGSWLARLGFVSFAVALWCFWPVAAALAGEGARPRAARVLGGVASFALVGVSAVPAAQSQVVHAVFVSLSAGAGIAAALVIIPVLSSRVDAWTRGLSWLVVAAFAVPLAQYLRQGLTGAGYAEWLAGSQKIATSLLLLWMSRLMWQARVGGDEGKVRAATEA